MAIALAGADMPLHRLACSQAALGAALLFLGCCDILPEAAAGISLARTAFFFVVGAFGSATTARFMRLCTRDSLELNNDLNAVTAGRRDDSVDGNDVLPMEETQPQRVSPFWQLRETFIPADDRGDPQRILLRGEVLVVGLVTFVSLSVHNLLEGMSILFAVQEGLESGLRLAAAISLENIPEGLCIALPLYFATRSKSIAIRLALFSGMLEPLGVLLPGLFLENYMTQTSISSVLAIIAGILVFVALAEMLPLAVKTAGTRTMPSLSVWMGCGVFSATLLQPLLMYHARVGLVQ